MILPDSAIWIDHLRRPDSKLAELLAFEQVLGHPFVTGEVMLGSIASRDMVAAKLSELPQLRVAPHAFVAVLIEERELWGRGIGYVDVHLLASVMLHPGARFWTRDKRLRAQAERLDLAVTLR